MLILEISQIAAPAGTAKTMALQRTISVLSIREVYIVCHICGGL